MSTGTKVDYQTWAQWVERIELLREAGFGWNELSKLHGHSERGYIASAVEHRSVLDEGTIQTTEELIASDEVQDILRRKGLIGEKRNGKPAGAGDPPARLVELVHEIRDVHDGTFEQIFEYVPHYSSADSFRQAYYACRRGAQQTVEPMVMENLEVLVELLREGSVVFRDTKEAAPACDFEREGHGVMRRCELEAGHEGPHRIPTAAGPRDFPQVASKVAKEEQREREPAPDAPGWDDVHSELVELGVEIDDRAGGVVGMLEAMKASTPKMLHGSIDAEIEKVRRVLSQAVEELLSDFE